MKSLKGRYSLKMAVGISPSLIRACGEGDDSYERGSYTWNPQVRTVVLSAILIDMAVSGDPKTWTYNLLREFCERHELKRSGKKSDLLER